MAMVLMDRVMDHSRQQRSLDAMQQKGYVSELGRLVLFR